MYRLLIALSVLPASVFAALELFPTTATSTYPFALHLPLNNNNDNSARSNPTSPALIFLHGSGARGTADELREKASYDGVGWLISQFDSGNKSGSQQVVAEEYL
jgi:predicted peptidase